MCAMFRSTRVVPVAMGRLNIPCSVFVTVLGVDGGTYLVQNLNNGKRSHVSREMFDQCFERWT